MEIKFNMAAYSEGSDVCLHTSKNSPAVSCFHRKIYAPTVHSYVNVKLQLLKARDSELTDNFHFLGSVSFTVRISTELLSLLFQLEFKIPTFICVEIKGQLRSEEIKLYQHKNVILDW